MSAHPARPLVLIVLGLSCFVPPADGAWNANGNPVCTAAGAQTAASAVPDGSGGMIVTWLDARPGTPGIYAQRIQGDGTIAPGWPADGVLCSGTTATGTPAPVPDAAGGVLMMWYASGVIYAQRVDANGVLHAGWPAGGNVIVSAEQILTHGFAAVTDGSGGAYFTRVQYNGNQSMRLGRITSDGTLPAGWTQAGVLLITDFFVSLFGLRPDPTGGVVCALGRYFDAMVDSRNGQILRVSSSGTISGNVPATAYLSGGAVPGGIFHVAGAPDGAGGIYGTWHDYNYGPATHGDYGQHANSSGTAQWTAPYTVPLTDQVHADGLVGVWLAGRPWATQRLEVHRRLANGSLPAGWTGAGVLITTPTNLNSLSCVPMATELVVGWSENGAGGEYDIRALSVGQDGVIPGGWDPGGILVCAASGDQLSVSLLPDGQGGVLACWEDRRSGASVPDIYANRIAFPPAVDVGPEPPSGFGILGAWPNPARDRIDVAFALNGDAPATLDMLDLAGRLVHRSGVSAGAGRRTVPLTVGELANGVYFVRVVQAGRAAITRVAVAR